MRRKLSSHFVAVIAWLVVGAVACRSDSPTRTAADDWQVLAKAEKPNDAPLRADTAELVEPLALPTLDSSSAPPATNVEFPSAPQAQRRRPYAVGPAPQASNPAQAAGSRFDESRWTELIDLDPTFVLDLRYATANNFVGEPMYACGRCFLRPAAAQALARVQDSLRTLGLGLKLYDCYRPRDVQWRLWEKVPDRRYVADPRKGSQHNRGAAVDLTLVTLATGRELDMGTTYDFFGHEAWHAHTPKFAEPIRSNRERLRRVMTGMGWRETSSEWWHYSFRMSQPEIEDGEWGCQ